jgi:hypothetical protein
LRGSGALHPRWRLEKRQRSQRPAEKAASRTRPGSNPPHNQTRLHHGEGSWCRPEQAMEPSGAAWPWRSDRAWRRGSEGSNARRVRWRDRRVDGAGKQNRPVPGSVGVADGPFRATLILPARGEASTGMKQAYRRRPLRRTVSRSGRSSRNAKQHHGHPGWARPLRASPSAQRKREVVKPCLKRQAREHLPPPGGFAACPPPQGADGV